MPDLTQDNTIHDHTQEIDKPYSGKTEEPLTIPWKGRILTPTPSQLRESQGNLDNVIAKGLSREPEGKEAHWREIRIRWNGETLKPTPAQIQVAKGNLDSLSSYLHTTPKRRSNSYFQKQTFTTGAKKVYVPKSSRKSAM